MEFHIALQFDGTSQEGMVTWKKHPSTTFCRTAVNRQLYRLGVVCLSITYCPCSNYVIYRLCE